MSNEFVDKVALITGAGSGIGRATALAFAAGGARVAVNDRDESGGPDTVRMIQDAGGEAIFVQADVTAMGEVQAMVDTIVAAWGRLDIAFNNAGTESAPTPAHLLSEEAWSRVITVNLTGVWHCMKAEIPVMLAQGAGAIVNCASVAGLVGFQASAGYVASKHGVVGLTKSAALDYATQGIRINAVCPGVIRTAMVDRVIAANPDMEAMLTAQEPIGRLGTPEEIADAVLWLTSDRASFVTGQAIAVDGGFVVP